MKKIAAIFLLVILFFNWYGYRIAMMVLIQDADKQLEARLDNNDYDESQLIELRVSLNMPYQASQADFERCYGEMEVDGRHYTYVKRKIESGYLVLKCIPNSSKEKIHAAGNDFFKMTNGLGQPEKKQDKNQVGKNFPNEYDGRENDLALNIPSLYFDKNVLSNSPFLHSICLPAPGHPPEAVLS